MAADRKKMFAKEYVVDLDITQAAVRAGYSPKTAAQQGSRLFAREDVQKMIQAEMQRRSERTEITADRVLQEYARLGFFDPRKLFNDDGSPKGIHELDDDTAAVLAGLEVMEVYEGHGENREFVGYLKKYKLANKLGALDSIARHLGMFNDKVTVTIDKKLEDFV